MSAFLERRFALAERRTDVRTEALGGLTTFLTMSYILFVNPAILSQAGIPFAAVAVAIAGIPLTFDIAAGIGFGVLGFVTVMLVKGRARDVHPIMWALVPLFLAFYAEDWLSANVF